MFLELPGNRLAGLYWLAHFEHALLEAQSESESGREPWRTALAAAAFYDLEGTLVSTNLVHTLGFYARNAAGSVSELQEERRHVA